MDAMQRRLNMFRDELKSDIPSLQAMLDEKRYEDIRAFAHKYKMRLDYFGFDELLELCKQIVQDHKDNKLEDQAQRTSKLIDDLKSVAKKLNTT